MVKTSPDQSNPFSTGSGGANFETRVQAAFTILMLTGRISPCLPPWPITRLKLQGSYAGFKTDDFIVHTKDPISPNEAKLLAQIKHDLSIAESDETFTKVIAAAWNDFNDPSLFTAGVDAIVLITGPLSARDINNVRTLFEWARHSEHEGEFLNKVNARHFSSSAKRVKLQAFRATLTAANGGTDVSDKQLWEFLRSYHLLGYDLDTADGSTLSLIQSLIGQSSNQTPSALWSQVLDAVQSANQNAGTVTTETLPREIRDAFISRQVVQWDSDLRKLKEHGEYIIGGVRTSIGGVHIKRPELFAQLLDASEQSGLVFIAGGRGSGKSSLVREFSEYMNGRAPVFCLRTEDLDQPHLDNVFSSIGLGSSIGEIEAGFALMPKRYLILESIEKLLELQNFSAFTDLLQFLNTHPGWTVIATGRDYAYQQIVFNYLQPTGVSNTSLTITNFNAQEVESLCATLEPLKAIAANPSLEPLLHNPFFADLAYRVTQAGTRFSATQGEREFRAAVWRDVIAKEHVRIAGMPLKRRQTFVEMAVARAKQMAYGVSERDFDSEAVLKLEEDDLVRRDTAKGLISPAHDVLEDWALERYIEDIYREASDDVPSFLDAVGDEPAMNRAFRLWLYQKLRLGDDVKGLILDLLSNPNVQRYWQDQTISAVLLSGNPYAFLAELGERLLDNEAELLKRFCFVLRISCKTPNQDLMRQLGANKPGAYLYLQPYGSGWNAIIRFLFENKERLPNGLTAHVVAILDEWSSLIHIEEDLPEVAREAGLLALSLLTPLKDSYLNEGKHRTKLLSVMIKTIPAIREEFDELLNTDVFVAGKDRRPQHVDDFCKMALGTFDTAFLCKHVPDTVIKLALEGFFVDESDDDPHEMWHLDVEHCFGLHAYKHEFFPASGSKGPFQHLLRFHPRKGLDFILELLNRAGDKYAHSNLDSPDRNTTILRNPQNTSGEQIELMLDDQTSVKQCCSGRLWVAYRGFSVVPYLLQSALMALENWLIGLAEQPSSHKSLEWVFGYALRNSNSVMPTSVLASLATGFPNLLGKSALPLLQTPALYGVDMARTVRDQGGEEINWFASPFKSDPYAELYASERRTAALRPWRPEHLETLLVRLQFGTLREEAFAIIDELRSKAPNTESWRFRFHRIDSRGWKATEDQSNNRIIFEPQGLEPDLEQTQQQFQEERVLQERFMRMYLWAGKTFDRQKPDREYYPTWNEALQEAKSLAGIMEGSPGDLSEMYMGAVVKAAAIFLRDHSTEMIDDDASWCDDAVVKAVIANAHTDDSFVAADKTDIDGTAPAASVLSMLFDLAKSDEDKLFTKQLIARALTHRNANVRDSAANGIREHLWERDRDFAQNCVYGAIEFARLQAETSHRRRRSRFLSTDADEGVGVNVNSRVDDFRQRLANEGISQNADDINKLHFQTHSPWYMLAPCLMVPDGSTDPIHVALLSRMLTLFFETEESTGKHRDDRIDDDIHIHSELRLNFTKRFAEYVVALWASGSRLFADQLVKGSGSAPEVTDYLLLSIAVVTENKNNKKLYWAFWKEVSKTVQDIAIKTADQDSKYQGEGDSRKLIRGMLHCDTPWQKVDYETQEIALGKDLILEFVNNAGTNVDVFEALSSLMYHFPRIFFSSGVHILARHQSEVGGSRLLAGVNTAFYLEGSIQRFLQIDETGPLTREMHHSCFSLLNALVETASSRAYYLREQLIHSRRIQ